MSISTALSNALSGLGTTSRAAQIVSSNLANAATDGYGVRRLSTSAATLGGQGAGVRINGVDRLVDPLLIGARRGADASLGQGTTQADFARRIETAIGTPDDPASLTAHINAFEASLVTAANRPESQTRLTAVFDAATRLAGKLNTLSETVQAARMEADQGIARDVDFLNSSLAQIHMLNTQIHKAQGASGNQAALYDQQQALIDGISPLIPVRELRDATGRVSLYSADGMALLDDRPAVFGFDPATVMAPDLTQANTGLSGLRLNDHPVVLDGAFPALQGGRLAAQFALRDDLAITAQARLDAVARDLTTRLDDPALDLTLTPGDPGLFTDAGNLAIPANELGLAGRLRINARVDPGQGGALWRLRDGLGATVEGPPGQAGLLNGTLEALRAVIPTQSGGFSTAGRNLETLATDLLSMAGQARQSAEVDESFAASQHSRLRSAELATGVDTDHEMQELLRIEQAYAANARLVQTVEDMLDQLMRI
ncbi:flagellar hook-associated protein FlgK [Rhodophyticola sp. CCM32]|uniref:flagellar hook-associated protein FlgK n=1 Tax=Rhodophyticola sp. CCM32 TaxID=2916397 RepID=UPI00107F70D6|nr:flagellar hook-associated protein FlgK [Rhodophyticola sp. CCM32]QBY02234.1 flagellar hook-associated protein FlgK [Rhodophyticola sp. CCM32]